MTLIKFDTAKLAKEVGFNMEVEQFYYNNGLYVDRRQLHNYNGNTEADLIIETYSCPTQSELQAWLRNEHDLIVTVTYNRDSNLENHFCFHINDFYVYEFTPDSGWFNIYEEALEAGLTQALNYLKEKHELGK